MIRSQVCLAAMLAFLAGACGGETKPPPSEQATRLVKVCTDEGGDPAMCQCQGAKLDELKAAGGVSDAVLRAHVLSQEGNNEAADELMAGVSREEFFEGLSSVGLAMQECAGAS
ncbi:MAG: hypothetical protein R3C46_10765 [Hyphomonadaceae bacterium]